MKKPFLHINQRKPQPMAFVPIARGSNRLEVRNEGDEHEIVLIGSIGKSWWDDSGITEQEVRDALKAIPKGKPITVKVNSEGGSVKEGLGIYNAFRERSNDLTARVTGYALSIASVFPLAAAKVVSPKSAIWMIHKAWSWAQGNADDMKQASEMLDTHDQTLAEIYAEHTGKSKEECLECMAAETWIRGSAAVDFGLADEGDEEEDDDSQAVYRPLPKAYLERCANLSPEILNMISAPMQGAVSVPVGAGNNQNRTSTQIIMDRTKMIALLKKWGVTFNESATDAELLALVEAGKPTAAPPPPAPQPAPVAVVSLEEFRQEKRKRIRGEVIRRAENKISNDRLDWWIDLAMRDGEEGVYAQIDAMPAQLPGGQPIGGTVEIVNEGEFDRISKLPTPQERYQAALRDWDQLIAAAQRMDARGERPRLINRYQARPAAGFALPQNANTLSATITTSFLLDGAITNLQNRWAPLMAFSRDFSTDAYKPKATAVLKNVSATTAAQTNATNFEAGEGDTIDPISVTLAQYTKNFEVTNAQLNSGLRMNDLVVINSAGIANKIIEVATAPITQANFTTYPALVSAAAAFGFNELATLWGNLQKSPIKNVILDGTYLARIINVPTFFQQAGRAPGGGWAAFGWDYIAQNSDWTGAGANTVGFACNPQAIVCVAGLPLTPPEGIPGNTLAISTAQVPEVGISIAHYSWFSLGTRTAWNSYDLMFGASKGDATAGQIVASA